RGMLGFPSSRFSALVSSTFSPTRVQYPWASKYFEAMCSNAFISHKEGGHEYLGKAVRAAYISFRNIYRPVLGSQEVAAGAARRAALVQQSRKRDCERPGPRP